MTVTTNLNNYGYQNLRNLAEGVLAENGYRTSATDGGTQPATQVVACSLIPLLGGNVVTSILVSCSTPGTLVTRVELALLDSAGVRRGTTGDVKAAFATNGVISSNLTAPYTIPADGLYYAAWLCVATGPVTLAALNNNTTDDLAAAVGTGSRLWGEMAGQATIPANVTIGAASTPTPWFAVL